MKQLLLKALLVMTGVRAMGAELPDAPPFSLQRWNGAGEVQLSEFAGKIVVLDFFAYWCVPCQRASSELEARIQKHYAAAKGNPHGIPVQVLAINVEADNPAKTEMFVRKAQLDWVVSDRDGATLKAYGGTSLPHIAIIDGTSGTRDQPAFKIVYRKAGFDGVEKLRAVIDRLGAGTGRPQAGASDMDFRWFRERLNASIGAGQAPMLADLTTGRKVTDPTSETASTDTPVDIGSRWSHRISGVFDGLFSTDVQLSQTSGAHRMGRGNWESTVTAGIGTIGIDYQPVSFDFLGHDQRLDEIRGFAQGSVRWRLLEDLTGLAGVGIYDGYTDYRSAWLAEYYRQQFSGLPGYVGPTPAGHNFSVGARWEYLPGSGFAQLDASYLNDEIALGYEIDFDGLRKGRPFLYTSVWKLTLENVVHRRARLLHEFRRVETSDRDPRFGYQGTANLALGERWTARVQGGYASEQPQFESWYVGGTIEWELSDRWFLMASGRYYDDTGEIENSNFSNAAPSIQAWQAGAGIRYVGEGWVVKLYAAPYATRYSAFGIGTAFFGNLYRNRDWGLMQLAVDREF